MRREGCRYLVEVPRAEGWTTVDTSFQFAPRKVFGREAPLVVEVGSGNGDQVVFAAAANPDCDYLALEVWQPGIAKTVSKAFKANVQNLRIIEVDAAQAFPVLFEDESLQEVWTFFPDPWRKTRHQKRRLVNPVFAEEVARTLTAGGKWRLATDWGDYAQQMGCVLSERTDFFTPHTDKLRKVDLDSAVTGSSPRFAGRVQTSFERRAIAEGRNVHDFLVVKSCPATTVPENQPRASH